MRRVVIAVGRVVLAARDYLPTVSPACREQSCADFHASECAASFRWGHTVRCVHGSRRRSGSGLQVTGEFWLRRSNCFAAWARRRQYS